MKVKNLLIGILTLSFFPSCSHHINPSIVKDLFIYTKTNGKNGVIQNKKQWELKRKQGLINMQKLMGSLPKRPEKPLEVKYSDSLFTDSYFRYTILLIVAGYGNVPAYLYRPLHLETRKKYLAMLALNETDPVDKDSPDGHDFLEEILLKVYKEIGQYLK